MNEIREYISTRTFLLVPLAAKQNMRWLTISKCTRVVYCALIPKRLKLRTENMVKQTVAGRLGDADFSYHTLPPQKTRSLR